MVTLFSFQGPLPSLFNRPTGDSQRSNPTTPTAPKSSHQFPMGVFNDSAYSNTSKQDDQDSCDSSTHSSPSPQPNSFSSPGYNYGSGSYQHPYGSHYGGVQYASPYGIGVTTPNSAKSPVTTSPSSISSHFMFGNAYNSMYTSQSGYGNYPYMGMNNGVPTSSAAHGKDGKGNGEDSSPQEGINKPFNATGEGAAKPQSKSPKTLLT